MMNHSEINDLLTAYEVDVRFPDVSGMEIWRQQEDAPPHEWWWYLDVLAQAPAALQVELAGVAA